MMKLIWGFVAVVTLMAGWSILRHAQDEDVDGARDISAEVMGAGSSLPAEIPVVVYHTPASLVSIPGGLDAAELMLAIETAAAIHFEETGERAATMSTLVERGRFPRVTHPDGYELRYMAGSGRVLAVEFTVMERARALGGRGKQRTLLADALRHAASSARTPDGRWPARLEHAASGDLMDQLSVSGSVVRAIYSPTTGDVTIESGPRVGSSGPEDSSVARAIVQRLDGAIGAFRASRGRLPASLEELVSHGVLAELPETPRGAVLHYSNTTGEVTLTGGVAPDARGGRM